MCPYIKQRGPAAAGEITQVLDIKWNTAINTISAYEQTHNDPLGPEGEDGISYEEALSV